MQDRWTHQIDEISANFKNRFGTLTLAQLNWKPNESTWSIGQNLDHLIVINQTYHPVINAVKAGTYRLPFISKFEFMVSFFERTVLNAVQPDRKRKMKTFPIWEPTKSDFKEDIWERFENQQTEMKKLILSSSDLLDKGTIISSPANSHIVYRLEIAFDVIVTHERRHFEQSIEVDRMRKQLGE